MHNIIEKQRDKFEKIIIFLKSDLLTLRTGRVAPSFVESVKVESYGVISDLLQLAAISAPEPQTIVIKPWDKNIIKNIEKALQASDLNVNPVVSGDIIRLNFSPLTEETRKDLVKVLHRKLEEARISTRSLRDKIKDEVLVMEQEKAISEDEKFAALKDLDTLTKEYNDMIKDIGDKKEQEIMTI